ncbi:hypothetical protein J6590_006596 [Homalodisca vitripennis]|nr:hypothetical protein J6590_006596 [Homalodisca vitripennis]
MGGGPSYQTLPIQNILSLLKQHKKRTLLPNLTHPEYTVTPEAAQEAAPPTKPYPSRIYCHS